MSQRPIRPSQDEVRRCEPEGLAETEETGAVCKWRDASVRDFDSEVPDPGRAMRVMRAVRSWDALPTRTESSVIEPGWGGMTHMEEIGALCAVDVWRSFWE